MQLQDDDDLSDKALMKAATIGDGSSSTTLPNTNTLATVKKIAVQQSLGRRAVQTLMPRRT